MDRPTVSVYHVDKCSCVGAGHSNKSSQTTTTMQGWLSIMRTTKLSETLINNRDRILDVLSMREEDQADAMGKLLRRVFDDGYDSGFDAGWTEGYNAGFCNGSE